ARGTHAGRPSADARPRTRADAGDERRRRGRDPHRRRPAPRPLRRGGRACRPAVRRPAGARNRGGRPRSDLLVEYAGAPRGLLRRAVHGGGAPHAQHPPLPGAARVHRQPRRGQGHPRRRVAGLGHRGARPEVRDRPALRGDGRRRRRLAAECGPLRGTARAPVAGLRPAAPRRARGRRALLHERHHREPQGRALLTPLERPARAHELYRRRARGLARGPRAPGRADVPRQRLGPGPCVPAGRSRHDHALALPPGRAAGAPDLRGARYARRRGPHHLARPPAPRRRARLRPVEPAHGRLRRRRRPALTHGGLRGAPRDPHRPGLGNDGDQSARLGGPPARGGRGRGALGLPLHRRSADAAGRGADRLRRGRGDALGRRVHRRARGPRPVDRPHVLRGLDGRRQVPRRVVAHRRRRGARRQGLHPHHRSGQGCDQVGRRVDLLRRPRGRADGARGGLRGGGHRSPGRALVRASAGLRGARRRRCGERGRPARAPGRTGGQVVDSQRVRLHRRGAEDQRRKVRQEGPAPAPRGRRARAGRRGGCGLV
ncbi:MAG: CoA ligase @ Long-chain fatty-acid-CoA ligase, Mycobacterial subgroup FadD14, partial [uncultured Solirubrobacterales bacterium]